MIRCIVIDIFVECGVCGLDLRLLQLVLLVWSFEDESIIESIVVVSPSVQNPVVIHQLLDGLERLRVEGLVLAFGEFGFCFALEIRW